MLGLKQPHQRVWNQVAENWLHSKNVKMLGGDLGREKCLCDGLMLVLQSEKNLKKKSNNFCRFIYSFGQYWLRHAVWEALWQAVGLKGNLVWVPLWKGSQTREGDCEPSAVGEGRIQMESIPVLWSCNILSYSHAPWVTVMESPDKASQIGRQVGWTKWPRIPALLDLSHNFSEPQSCQLWKGN